MTLIGVRLLPGVENTDEGGVHDADGLSWQRPAGGCSGGAVVGKVSFSSARCRWFGTVISASADHPGRDAGCRLISQSGL
ncbi:hypothetical protein [Streptomyces sp. NPDC005476]|uniref:hypothetical protein n=1 Tax=Streptomyces sp. NPDC005476 TaxID=3156882 RepID=UPI0034573996